MVAWTIAASDREKRTGGELALMQVDQLRILGNPSVFAGRGRSHFNSWDQRKQALDKQLKFDEPWVIHDF
jgi:hypothetical protein